MISAFRFAFLALVLTFFIPATAQQTKPFSIGVVDSVQSLELGEKRMLNIYLPAGYNPDSAKTYPVIYLLDGSANEDFVHTAGLVQFLTMIEKMSPAIVIGIANVDRRRDFTFPTTIEADKKAFPTTGGSAKFIAFLEKELQPYIEKHYKTNDDKILIGQSLGGLLATEILFKKYNLFSHYIIVSPSLWWDNQSLLKQETRVLHSDLPLNIHVLVGQEGKVMKRDARKLAAMLKKSRKPNLKTTFTFLPKENHATILHNAIYKALGSLNLEK